jgi:hypothetical protein
MKEEISALQARARILNRKAHAQPFDLGALEESTRAMNVSVELEVLADEIMKITDPEVLSSIARILALLQKEITK